jgi:hypothetical protein
MSPVACCHMPPRRAVTCRPSVLSQFPATCCHMSSRRAVACPRVVLSHVLVLVYAPCCHMSQRAVLSHVFARRAVTCPRGLLSLFKFYQRSCFGSSFSANKGAMSGRRVLNISERLPSGLASEDDIAAQPVLEISPYRVFSQWKCLGRVNRQPRAFVRSQTHLLVRSTTAPKLSASPASADLWLA